MRFGRRLWLIGICCRQSAESEGIYECDVSDQDVFASIIAFIQSPTVHAKWGVNGLVIRRIQLLAILQEVDGVIEACDIVLVASPNF
jgi:hypothetical protein